MERYKRKTGVSEKKKYATVKKYLVIIPLAAMAAVLLSVFVHDAGGESAIIPHEDLGRLDSETSLFCLGAFDEEFDGKTFVATTQEEYQELLLRKSDHNLCKIFTPPPIDFSQKTLLGQHTSGNGCSVNFENNVFKNQKKKEIIFQTKILEEGRCEMYVERMNWVLVPKIPRNYWVVFDQWLVSQTKSE